MVAFDPADRESKLLGLIPVGWFPGALVFDAPRRQLCVANIKGHPATPKPDETGHEAPAGAAGFNSHQYHGSLSLVPLPEARDLPALRRPSGTTSAASASPRRSCRRGPTSPPAPCPSASASRASSSTSSTSSRRTAPTTRCSATSTAGNGDPRLCIFGERITPNQHKLVREFVLLDNTYCAGILSADGHQWSTTAFGTDYLENSFAGFPRSYPDGMGEDEADALAYSPAGFLWDNALAPRRPHPQLRRVHGARGAVARPEQEGHARLPRLLPDLEGRERRGRLRERVR